MNYSKNLKFSLKILALAGAWLSVLVLQAGPVFAASATMSLLSSGSAAQGSIISVTIKENSGSEPVNAVQANLSYSADLLSFVGISSSSAFGVVAQNSGGGGAVQIARGTTSAVTGNQTVAYVSFKALSSGGTASVSVAGGSSIVSANTNGNILAGTSGTNIVLKAQPPAPVAPPPDTTPPKITDIKSTNVTFNSSTITWTTSEPASSEVDYGLNNGYGIAAVDNNYVTDHKVTLSSPIIAPGIKYHYLVKSTDPSGNTASSPDATFTTQGATLLITVLNQKNNKPVKGAKVELGSFSGITDKKGQLTLSGFALGKQAGAVTYLHKQTAVSVQINSIDPNGKPQAATFKIQVPTNLMWFIVTPLFLLLLVAAWFLGLEEGEGKIPSLNRLKASTVSILSMRSAKKAGSTPPKGPEPPGSQQPPPPPTVITPTRQG
jgi:hypothetical protein